MTLQRHSRTLHALADRWTAYDTYRRPVLTTVATQEHADLNGRPSPHNSTTLCSLQVKEQPKRKISRTSNEICG